MPLVFIGAGVLFVFLSIKGNPSDLYSLVKGDFSGPNSFIYWMTAIVVLGALGYIKGLEQFSKLFLILVLIVLFLDNGGFFNKFQTYLHSTTTATAPTATAQTGS
jgi:hypothetical protein